MTGGRAGARATPASTVAEVAGEVADGWAGAWDVLRGPGREAGGAGTPGAWLIGGGEHTLSTTPDRLSAPDTPDKACCETAMIDVA